MIFPFYNLQSTHKKGKNILKVTKGSRKVTIIKFEKKVKIVKLQDSEMSR